MANLESERARAALGSVHDPLFGKDLLSLAYVQNLTVEGAHAKVRLELPTPAHPHRPEIEAAVKKALVEAGAAEVEIDFTWKVTERFGRAAGGAGADRLPGVKNVIAVAAGKGGVGKSTIATNLALALAAHGPSVGLMDADVYGPSVPTMLGPPEIPPGGDSAKRLSPAVHYGVKVMSVGFFVEREGAVVWRGPMIHKLLQQFIEDVDWGALDYLVVDLPPGTGDAQLSLSQLIPITGAIMVTTPQEVALIDVAKAVTMFKKVEIPILGVIENMSGYVCPSCGHHDEIFSKGGGKALARELGSRFFGEVPIDAKVRFGGDSGRPVVIGAPDSEHAKIFMSMAAEVAGEIARVNGPTGGTARRAPGLVQIR
jgi:ATP-binding protein involved in chromosome partitioning